MAIKVSLTKLSILNPYSKKATIVNSLFQQISTFNNFIDLEKHLNSDESIQEKYEQNLLKPKDVIAFKVYQYASTKYFINHAQDSTMILLGMTSGGRTINERPTELIINYGCDIDISGAYGSQLKTLIVPLGKPRILAYTPNTSETDKITLGAFVRKHKKALKSNLFKIVVSGELSFSQDLIISKLPTFEYLEKKALNLTREDNASAIDAPFVLLTNEIKNATITGYLLEIIQKVSTNFEYKEILNLKVQSAIYWSEEDRINSIEDFSNIILKDTP